VANLSARDAVSAFKLRKLYAAPIVIAGDGKVYNFTAPFVCELG
jgi:hypothetical protein